MITTVLLGFAITQCTLLAYSFQWSSHKPLRLLLLRAMLVGMIYDNTIVAIGPWCVDVFWYELASVLRFVLHSAVLPFLTLFALSIMVDAKVLVARNKLLRAFLWLFTCAALAYGLWHEVLMLELEVKDALGHAKMGSVSKLPPIATILTNIAVLPMAAAVWRRGQWPWMFAGALFIFLLNGSTGAQPWGFIAGNFGEVVFILALLKTERHFSRIAS